MVAKEDLEPDFYEAHMEKMLGLNNSKTGLAAKKHKTPKKNKFNLDLFSQLVNHFFELNPGKFYRVAILIGLILVFIIVFQFAIMLTFGIKLDMYHHRDNGIFGFKPRNYSFSE